MDSALYLYINLHLIIEITALSCASILIQVDVGRRLEFLGAYALEESNQLNRSFAFCLIRFL
jgi:hypothetical protein